MQKIIITGATGFIGRNIAENLNKNGIKVIATGRSAVVGKELQKQGIEFIQADITDQKQINKVFLYADYVIHCAAKAGDWGKYREFFDTNVIGTRNITKACITHKINKVIFISTPSVYFSGKDRYDISENEPLPSKQFAYGKTKLIAENELLASKSKGINTIILRPRAVYGKYDNIIIPRILKLSEKKQLPLINNGRALVDITYIDNLVCAIKKCISANEDSWNEIYNISNGDPIKLRDWFAMILEIFERPYKPKNVSEFATKSIVYLQEIIHFFSSGNLKPTMTRFSAGYMSKSMTMSIKKAQKKLNYLPEITNYQSFKKYRRWYNNNNKN